MIYLGCWMLLLVCWWAGVRLWCWLVTGAEGASYCLALTLSRWLLQHRRKRLLGWQQQTLSWRERPIFLSYCLFSRLALSPEAVLGYYYAVQSFALNLKYWKWIKSDGGVGLSCECWIWYIGLSYENLILVPNVIAIFLSKLCSSLMFWNPSGLFIRQGMYTPVFNPSWTRFNQSVHFWGSLRDWLWISYFFLWLGKSLSASVLDSSPNHPTQSVG